ncbi:MAG: CoA-acylating methylmalonate-semialdehyde dehydrogenase [Peptoniphilaceae bacterium]|nr:CoA-acylating methylmalonate-semialdehyde dehydrogenase [Peptoniphilaceae bacterium]MDD7433687.1 CoA-acylating methylmalonate-semialdehyde dehydrogenase [Peptoniphilaceae bacterium]MDD7542619.1 CoA-acylating methylmalonate-semialdehyde dehydrogenase [Peptoniphilaceae bacterium]MDY3075523.1 CoA-acylating methylmalonate-semialdehyde dehydrogenase [Peptoniphilaceae bacterium]MDY5766289.1 CoA-acylating methylmalonate-semialdehyde dehydrogenase [Peptoniphilaceae bacterium]
MAEILKMKYCVNGEWKDSKTEKYFDVTDSSTGEVIAKVPSCTKEEVEEAITSAQNAFESWSGLSLSRRTQYLFTWRNVLVEHLEELALLCAKELGKNIAEARGDVLKAIEPTEFATGISFASQGHASLNVTTGYDTATYREPLGVVGGIVPFNFPAMIPWGWMVPLALATGNTVVLKANTQTPLTSMRMLELFYDEAKFPKGVVNLVTCSRHEAEILLTDSRVKAITFVGTTGVGKHIYSVASANGKRVQAQCEAKNHALVLEDADLESATKAIINSTYGCAGMRCMALPVIVVQESIADKFVALLKEKAMAMKVGCAYDESTQLGPVVSQKHKDSVIRWIDKGIEEGAELILDGRNIVVEGYEGGYFVGPTIFDHVTEEMSVGTQEIFGPVTLIKRVKDFEEGLKIMNRNPFANGSVIFTQSGYYAREFEMHTDGGMVGINVGIPVPTAYFPFSGNKDSFFGDLHVLGADGVRFFTRAKTVTKHWFDEHSKYKAVDTWEGSVDR